MDKLKKNHLRSTKKGNCTVLELAIGRMDPRDIPWTIKRVKKMAMKSGMTPPGY